MYGHPIMTNLLRLLITALCVLAAFAVYKTEVMDHEWITISRNNDGFVDGWTTPEDAVTKSPRWKEGHWDFDIVSPHSFRVRDQVNPIVGYVVPLALLGLAVFVALYKSSSPRTAGPSN